MLDNLKVVMYAYKVCPYAQGSRSSRATVTTRGGTTTSTLYECTHMWTGGGGGCIICAALLPLLSVIAQVQDRSK